MDWCCVCTLFSSVEEITYFQFHIQTYTHEGTKTRITGCLSPTPGRNGRNNLPSRHSLNVKGCLTCTVQYLDPVGDNWCIWSFPLSCLLTLQWCSLFCFFVLLSAFPVVFRGWLFIWVVFFLVASVCVCWLYRLKHKSSRKAILCCHIFLGAVLDSGVGPTPFFPFFILLLGRTPVVVLDADSGSSPMWRTPF